MPRKQVDRLTPQVRSRILEALPATLSATGAGIIAGVRPSSVRRWLRLGLQATSGLYGRFRRAVVLALQLAELGLVQKVAEHSDDWEQAAWLLERRWPQRWAAEARLARQLRRRLRRREGGDE